MDLNLALRPMSTSQVLDRTFSLYKKNFALFAGIAALPPALLLIAQAMLIFARPATAGLMSGVGAIAGIVVGVIVFAVIYLIGAALATGATVYAVSRAHLGNPATIAESYGAVQPLVLRIIGTITLISLMAGGAFLLGYAAILVPTFLLGLVAKQMGGSGILIAFSFLIGFGLFVVAAIWAVRIYCRYSLAVPACVVEKTDVSGSLRRSKFLTQQSLLRIFLIYLLMAVMGIVLSIALSIPNYIALALHHGPPTMPLQFWSLVSSFLAGTLAGPIGTIAISLMYYDNRVRKEAFDLQLMMQAIGGPTQTNSAVSASIG